MFERAKQFYREHEPICTAGFFIAGFLFDTMAVGRIDSIHNIIHQATYLFLCAYFIGLELREVYGQFSPSPRFRAIWRYHAGATHFMLGTLLNIYTLFYFKSASLVTSFVFMILLALLLAVNELKPFGTSGPTMRMTLFSLCLISYFTYLVPVLVGSIGVLAFIGSLIAATGAVSLLAHRLRKRLIGRPQVVWRHVVIPFAAVGLLFSSLYFAKLIPPVPLSISEIGIYHDIHWVGPRLALTMTRPRWKFWQHGDQTFLARPGDKIYCFASIFSPTRFKGTLQVRWVYQEPVRGWQNADAIPLEITGGREEGWRGITIKNHYQPGNWRVRVETSDGRELGRIGFTVVQDESTSERATHTVLR